MSFSSPVFTMPGASMEKLPFVHSHFKPRATFAKSFGGRRRYSKLNTSTRDSYSNVTKLPQITYNPTDKRTLITLGSVRRGERPEYPGFLGHAKIVRRNIENVKENDDKCEKKRTKMDKYRSLPDLAPKRNENNDSGKRSRVVEFVHNSLESLIFVDDDQANGDRSPSDTKPQGVKHLRGDISDNIEVKSLSVRRRADSDSHQASDKGTKSSSEDNTNSSRIGNTLLPPHSISKELDKKINEARGKSGMKRGRRKDKDHNIRILGDVMTSKRLTELLAPRRQESALTFD